MTLPASTANWPWLLPLLDEALALEDDRARGSWLAAQPADRREVLARLIGFRARIETSGFMGQAGIDALASHEPQPVADGDLSFEPGQRIGPWRLLALLGRGGMAEVWRAERCDGRYQREVALKLPRAASTAATRAGLTQRLALELRILASLQHPAIAMLLDGGIEAGQPWLALELVEGEPITAWAQRHGLNTPARVALFEAVLGAVAHAHERLVVHRDLKPANVLVTPQGRVKLLDFGIAKLLDADEASAAPGADTPTRIGERAMTPQYASPEQIAGQPLTTRSDVYALGVLLYELLTEQRPYLLQRGSAAELEEAILGAAVRPPSRAVADRRRASALRGDLDTIVLKAMHVDPAQRYPSAEALADDLRRHREHRPIAARPAKVIERLARLWRRQRVWLSAGAMASTALLLGLGWALLERRDAQAAAARAEAVQAFLAATLEGNDPQVAQGRPLTARELLDRSAARIDTDFSKRPDVQTRLHQTVATLYNKLGDMAALLRHADAALAGIARLGEQGSAAHLELLFQRHEALIDLARWDEARAATAEAQRWSERSAEGRRLWLPRLVGSQAWIDLHQGRIAEAGHHAARATALQEAATGPRSTEFMMALNNEAIIAQQSGHLARAVAMQRRIGEVGPSLPGHSTTDLLVERGNLAGALTIQGDAMAALDIFETSVPSLEKHLGPAHDRTLAHRMSWAFALADGGELARAEALLRENIATADRRGIAGDAQPTTMRAGLARVLNQAGRSAEARPLAMAALADFERRHPQPTWARERARWFAGEAMLGSGEVEPGLAMLAQVQQHLANLLPYREHPAHARLLLVRAVAGRARDVAQARAQAAEACQRLEASGADGSLMLPRCRAVLAWLDALALPADAGPARQEPARKAFVRARQALVGPLPARHPLRAQFLAAEAEIEHHFGASAAEVQTLRRAADAEHRRTTGHPLPWPLRLLS
jgi:serine/threonine-protein kinase